MWYWWFMFFCNLLIPLTLVAAGWLMWKHCPGEINEVWGYRTKNSMKNMDTWRFANAYCGRLWLRLGLVLLIPSALAQIPFMHSSDRMIGIVGGVSCGVQLVLMLGAVGATELALKRTFAEDGTRRDAVRD